MIDILFIHVCMNPMCCVFSHTDSTSRLAGGVIVPHSKVTKIHTSRKKIKTLAVLQ